VREERVGGAVELGHRDDVAPQLADVERGIVERRLPAAHAQRVHAALQGRHAPLQHRGRRIADPAVAKTVDLEIEEGGAVIGAVERIGDGLIDRDRHRLRRRIDFVAAVNGDRRVFHVFTSR